MRSAPYEFTDIFRVWLTAAFLILLIFLRIVFPIEFAFFALFIIYVSVFVWIPLYVRSIHQGADDESITVKSGVFFSKIRILSRNAVISKTNFLTPLMKTAGVHIKILSDRKVSLILLERNRGYDI